MLDTLKSAGESENGNKYFFEARHESAIMHVSAEDFKGANLIFNETMRDMIKYVGDEPDHPFLEKMYMHMALMYQRIFRIDLCKFFLKLIDYRLLNAETCISRTQESLWGIQLHPCC